MMPRPLLVAQNNYQRVSRITGRAAQAAHALGIAVHDLSSDADMTGRPALPPEGPWGPVLVMGSVAFVDQWARREPDLARWVFWDDARYDAAAWAQAMGDRYLNSGGRPTTVGEFVSSDLPAMHVRPRSGVKLIGDVVRDENTAGRRGLQGAVFAPAELGARNVDPTLPIWISPPRDIALEMRIWMIDGEAACWSTYRVEGRPEYLTDHPRTQDALATAAQLHDVYRPDRHYVIDLALCSDGTFRLVEYNPIHSSGWYAADPEHMLRAYFEAERI
jgi:hypothetical protein